MSRGQARATVALGLLGVVLAGASGCARMESHVYVKPDAGTDMSFALRVPAPIWAMIANAMKGQTPPTQQLPPGITLEERDEGFEHVWELRVAGEALGPMRAMCEVRSETRLWSTRYHLSIDPERGNPFGAMGMVPGSEVRFAALQRETGGWAQTPPDVAEGLKALGDLFGSGAMLKPEAMDPQAILEQFQPALYAHMPGRLRETNGQRVDEWTAKWTIDPQTLQPPPRPMTADSELPDTEGLKGQALRLTLHLSREIGPDALADLVVRGLLPNPVVEDRAKTVYDLDLYGEMVALALGLDELVGAERTEAVFGELGLTQGEPSLAVATKAAKRLPKLQALDRPAELGVADLARMLQGE